MLRLLAAVLVALSICAASIPNGSRAEAASAKQAKHLAAASSPRPAVLPVTEGVYDKNFFFFRMLAAPRATAVLSADPALSALTLRHRERLAESLQACGEKALCYVNAARWTDAEVAEVESALRNLCREPTSACRDLVVPLRKSGIMIRFHERTDSELLAESWRLSVSAVRHIISTYGEGAAPRYKNIDSMSHDPQSADFGRLLRTAVRVTLASDVKQNTFFSDGLKFALLLLAVDSRDEAGRFEPMERGENRAAFDGAKHVRWDRYPYSVILVPGQGPEDPGVRLAPEGMLRLELAVARYRQHAAPFIVVSGGYVHPARTPFCEAIEMKRALIEDYKVPPSAILIEPHARHTTTNLRNTARLMYRYGMPFTKPGIVVTDERQTAYIMTEGFDARNREETGVVPYLSKKQVSPVEMEFVPSVEALQVGFEDPLDP